MIDTEDCADSYVADGTANPRSIGFRILDPTDLIVTADGEPQTLNSDYTISGDTDGGFGVLTPNPVTPWAAGRAIFYKRATQPLQKAKILPGVPLPSAALERELDRRAMIEAEQKLTLGRAILAPDGGHGSTFALTDRGVVGIFDGTVSVQPLNDILSQTTTLYDDGPWGGDFTPDTNDGAWG